MLGFPGSNSHSRYPADDGARSGDTSGEHKEYRQPVDRAQYRNQEKSSLINCSLNAP